MSIYNLKTQEELIEKLNNKWIPSSYEFVRIVVDNFSLVYIFIDYMYPISVEELEIFSEYCLFLDPSRYEQVGLTVPEIVYRRHFNYLLKKKLFNDFFIFKKYNVHYFDQDMYELLSYYINQTDITIILDIVNNKLIPTDSIVINILLLDNGYRSQIIKDNIIKYFNYLKKDYKPTKDVLRSVEQILEPSFRNTIKGLIGDSVFF